MLRQKLSSTPNSTPISLIYPFAFFGGVFFLCVWTLHDDRLFSQLPHHEHETSDDLKKHSLVPATAERH